MKLITFGSCLLLLLSPLWGYADEASTVADDKVVNAVVDAALSPTPAKPPSRDIKLQRKLQQATHETIRRAWQPLVGVWGNGDEIKAVERLETLLSQQRIVATQTKILKDTQSFIDKLWRSLERFDLKGMYRLLPNELDGWRVLKIFGAFKEDEYLVGSNSDILTGKGGVPDAFGDLATVVKVKELSVEGNTHFLMNGAFSLGVGPLKWDSIANASENLINVLAHEAHDFQHYTALSSNYTFHDKVREKNPTLDKLDVQTLAPLWAAFPNMWRFTTSLGQVKDVVVSKVKDETYTHIRGEYSINTQQLKLRYPGLANHLTELDSLLKANIRVQTSEGTVLRATIDSETLTMHLEAYLSDKGGVLPVSPEGVVNTRPEPLSSESQNFTVMMDLTVDLLGVVTHIKDVEANLLYEKTATGARLVNQISKTPRIKVDGLALGFVPTQFINAVIPSSIEGLMEEFMSAACRGNDGKGVIAALSFEQASKQGSLVHFTAQAEALDNAMIRIGVGIVNDRLIPSDVVSGDIRRAFTDVQAAFLRDLNEFKRIVKSKKS